MIAKRKTIGKKCGAKKKGGGIVGMSRIRGHKKQRKKFWHSKNWMWSYTKNKRIIKEKETDWKEKLISFVPKELYQRQKGRGRITQEEVHPFPHTEQIRRKRAAGCGGERFNVSIINR